MTTKTASPPQADLYGHPLTASAHAVTEKCSQIEEGVSNLEDRANEVLNTARNRMEDITHEAERMARDNPIQTLLVVLGVGFALGVMFRR